MFLLLALVLFISSKADRVTKCVESHEYDENSGRCEWTGPKDACAELIDTWNTSWYLTLPSFPKQKVNEVNLKTTENDMDDHTVKVIVRRGCMFTGYAFARDGHLTAQEIKLVQNLVYGAYKVPNYVTRDVVPGGLGDQYDSLSRAHCMCDPTDANVNGHVPAPPANKKCIEHHYFNETTQQCEWSKDHKYCAELHTFDNRRMLLEIPNWPTNKIYDVNHWVHRHSENFHITVTHILVRQHCFATLLWTHPHEWKTMPTNGYGYHEVMTVANNRTAPGVGTARFICECLR